MECEKGGTNRQKEPVIEVDVRGMQLQILTCIKSKEVNLLKSVAHESSTMCTQFDRQSKKQRGKVDNMLKPWIAVKER